VYNLSGPDKFTPGIAQPLLGKKEIVRSKVRRPRRGRTMLAPGD